MEGKSNVFFNGTSFFLPDERAIETFIGLLPPWPKIPVRKVGARLIKEDVKRLYRVTMMQQPFLEKNGIALFFSLFFQ